ncbi:MAG: hypothetical protein WC501_03015 [Candidatus Micrarchaeia archaeon]
MNLSNCSEFGEYFTFSPSKSKPIYNWFYYKEAYSPECVDFFINRFKLESGLIVDPFCGIGTTLLYSKSNGFSSFGMDASELAVFVSKIKCRDYSTNDIENFKDTLKKFSIEIEKVIPSFKWNTEFFNPEKIFPKSSLNFILRAREFISKIDDKKTHDLFLLALISIVSQSSLLIKDGGVLKFDKRKSAIPAKIAFRKKIKKMIVDLEDSPIKGRVPEIELGDATKIKLKNECTDAIITSPPYLNNIDYTKVYGIELSLLSLNINSVFDSRNRSIGSFHGGVKKLENVPIEVEEFGIKYPIIGSYFSDIENVLKESFRILKTDSSAVFVVGNSIMHDHHILVDELFCQIGERIGFVESEIITSLKRNASFNRVKVETRESAVILKKK